MKLRGQAAKKRQGSERQLNVCSGCWVNGCLLNVGCYGFSEEILVKGIKLPLVYHPAVLQRILWAS
jgi:hypothetical protein